MYTIHILEPHKPQRHSLAFTGHLLRRQLQDLRDLRLLCVLDIVEADGGFVDKKFDEFGGLGGGGRFDEDGANADGLVELLVAGLYGIAWMEGWFCSEG